MADFGESHNRFRGTLINEDYSNANGLEKSEFINSHKEAVIKSTKNTGLFPSVVMAQMIIESNWGKGKTVQDANNYFGIKADSSWKGQKKLFNTPNDGQKQNYFRVYTSAKDSLIDHNNFLIQNPRYPKSGVFSSTTPEEQVMAIAKAGYAEDKNYYSKIMDIINSNNLKELDGLQGYKAIGAIRKNKILTVVVTATILFSAYFLIFGKVKKA